MDLMSLNARELSNKCLEAFQLCLTFRSTDPGLSNQEAFHDERFEYRLADFNLWIDGIGALAPSKASLDARLNERPIDLSLVKGNLVMLFQSLEDCLSLLTTNQPLEDALLDLDSALESLVSLSLAIRRTGRRSRLHKADRLFKPEEHAELRKHLEAIILLRPGPGPCYEDDEFRKKMNSLTPLQSHLVTANLKRRNRFIQAHLHSLGLKKRSVGFELPVPEVAEQASAPTLSSDDKIAEVALPAPTPRQPIEPLPAPMSVTSASVPESKLEYKEPVSQKTESTPMTIITQITASARYPRPRVSDNEQKLVQCPCCCQTLPVSEAKNNNRWRKHLAEDIRPYTCIFDGCPSPDVYYSSRSMLEQHFRQDHPPVWVCPLCDEGSVYSTMTGMMDHLHNTHPQAIGEDISAIISSSAQTKMGVTSCPLCEVKGDADSPELIDHVLEHVHDFSLRSLPWPKSSRVELGGEVGSSNTDSNEFSAVTKWLEGCEHRTGDIDPALKLVACDYGSLAIITEQIESQKDDKLGLDIGFADEHGDESAEAETDISQLTKDTLDSVKQHDGDREVVLCHICSAEWYRDENGLTCPKCQNELVEIVEPGYDPLDLALHTTPTGPRLSRTDLLIGLSDDGGPSRASKPSARGSTSGFRRFADRLFSRKKADHIEPQDDKPFSDTFVRFSTLTPQACGILLKVYARRLYPLIKKKSVFADFLRRTQGEDVLPTSHSVSDLDSFLHIMLTSYMDPLKALPPKDLTKPISKYFIKSSHRTIQRGTSLNSLPSSRSIREALYAGYRCIDIDVWDGDDDFMTDAKGNSNVLYQPSSAKGGSITKKLYRSSSPAREITEPKHGAPKITLSKPDRSTSLSEPIVTDRRTLAGHFSFREACEVIKSSAFLHSDLPVIVNMSVYARPEQQELMVRIMKEEWNGCLIDEPLEGCDPRFRLPKLEDLRNRILVRFSATRHKDVLDSDGLGKTLRREGRDYKGYIPIIQALDGLEIYMRSKPFEGFDNIGAKDPAHVFSLKEQRLQLLLSVPTDDISMENLERNQLFRHNRDFFFHVTPNSARVDSSNLEPLQFWKHGVQMAAISRHNIDEGMMLNEGMFADESGWVLKPDRYFIPAKGVPFGLPIHSTLMEVSIFVFQDQALELIKKDGIIQWTRDLSPLTMATLHVHGDSDHKLQVEDDLVEDEESGDFCYKHQFVPDKAITNIILKLCILRLRFADHSTGRGLIAWTSLRLDRLNRGYRLVPLYNEKGGLLSKQKMLIKFNIKLLE
ncbi:hypothetical protein ACJA88_013286 [Fusarium oxysporum]